MTETLWPTLPEDVEELVRQVAREASNRRLKLVAAESCTAGLLAALLTDVEGCAHVFERGFVAYTDEAKHEMLAVPSDLLRTCGAVSRPVARAMAEGALSASTGDIAVAVTGFAGPGRAGDEPGLVYFGLARRDGESEIREEHFGDIGRGGVRVACLRASLEMIQRSMARMRPGAWA
jgi:nicotinamide-nucleotide amidase